MVDLAAFTDDAREAALRPKGQVLAGAPDAPEPAPTMIRIRKGWGAASALAEELEDVSEFSLDFSRVEVSLQEQSGFSVYEVQTLELAILAAGAGGFALSPCARQRMESDPFLASLLPALTPLFDKRFDTREAFEAAARPLLAPLLPPTLPVAGEVDAPADHLLRTLALIVRQASTWVRRRRVRRAVDAVLHPEGQASLAGEGGEVRQDLADREAASFNPGQIVRRWIYRDYGGQLPAGGDFAVARTHFTDQSLEGAVELDSTTVAPARIIRAARNQVSGLAALIDALVAESGDKRLAELWQGKRVELDEIKDNIRGWVVTPRVRRLPLIADQKPVAGQRLGFGLAGDDIVVVVETLTGEGRVPAPSFDLHFKTDRPTAADMDQPEVAQPLADILQDPAELSAMLGQIDQLDLEAVESLAGEAHGYTDRSGGEARNQALSERRAHWLLDRVAGRCAGHWSIDERLLGALKAADADVCALEDLETLAGRRLPGRPGVVRAILEAVVGESQAARLLPAVAAAVQSPLTLIRPPVGHGEAEAPAPDDNPAARRAQLRVTAAVGT